MIIPFSTSTSKEPKSSSCFISSSAFGVVSLLNSGHSSERALLLHYVRAWMFIWLRWVLVTELGLGVASWGSCAGAQPARGLCACGAGSALAARGLGCSAARGILIPRPGIEPSPPALEAWSLNHRTAREIPQLVLLEAEACLHPSVFHSVIFSVSSRAVKRQTHRKNLNVTWPQNSKQLQGKEKWLLCRFLVFFPQDL